MTTLLADIEQWQQSGEPTALATVIETWGAAPRGVGAKMAFTPKGKLTGSVSGGCVESSVIEAGHTVLGTGRPQLLQFGVEDETAWSVGLSCGGKIQVFVEPLNQETREALQDLDRAEPPAANVTVVGGPAELLGKKLFLHGDAVRRGTLGPGLDEAAVTAARTVLAETRSRRATLPATPPYAEPVEVFVEVVPPPPTLVAVGGVHIAVALTAIAKTLGQRTIVIDPRRVFGSAERFPHVDQLIQAWPDEAFKQVVLNESTAVAMLTHDPKIDELALRVVLASPAYYIGALGSAVTQQKRRARLLESGLSESQVDRIHAPIGLDIGARTPEEIALSVMAEIIASRPRQKARRAAA
ncbi:MAG: XdhC family protein [Candidatus Binatia bacterium]